MTLTIYWVSIWYNLSRISVHFLFWLSVVIIWYSGPPDCGPYHVALKFGDIGKWLNDDTKLWLIFADWASLAKTPHALVVILMIYYLFLEMWHLMIRFIITGLQDPGGSERKGQTEQTTADRLEALWWVPGPDVARGGGEYWENRKWKWGFPLWCYIERETPSLLQVQLMFAS